MVNRIEFQNIVVPLFRRQCIITVVNDLVDDPKGFNLKEVPGRSYKIFKPVFSAEQFQLERRLLGNPYEVIWLHMLAVRAEALDIVGDEYLFIRGYRVGHTPGGDSIMMVVEAQVNGGCHLIDDDGRIGGDGNGRWYVILCPSDAEAKLVADLKAEEAKRRKSLRKCLFQKVKVVGHGKRTLTLISVASVNDFLNGSGQAVGPTPHKPNQRTRREKESCVQKREP
jgi:hypothetical protein